MQIGLFTQILLPSTFIFISLFCCIYIYIFFFVSLLLLVGRATTCGQLLYVFAYPWSILYSFYSELENRWPQATSKSGNLKGASLTFILLLLLLILFLLALTLG